ncbi:MAG: UvrB/UvrC motif-containing protein [bacterium]|nr:UvrB/UvrC motif-containing protein [bacterium]
MLCQECRKRPATVHVTRITNDQRTEVNLCEVCARELGEAELLAEPKFSLQSLLAGLLASESARADRRASPLDPCPRCGMTYQDFTQSGRLGCGDCYRQFETRLDPLLRRVHGATSHTGKRPARGARPSPLEELAELRKTLEGCVRREEFERAAEIRDRIRELEHSREGG